MFNLNLMQRVGRGIGNSIGAFRAGLHKAAGDWSALESAWSSVLGGSTTNRKRTANAQLREFQSWIYIILTTIYGRTSTVPWNLKVKRPDNTLDDLADQFTHPLYELLRQPNPYMTGTFFQQYIQTQLDLTGMSFITCSIPTQTLHSFQPWHLNNKTDCWLVCQECHPFRQWPEL
jgi:phage portal protein BeeE